MCLSLSYPATVWVKNKIEIWISAGLKTIRFWTLAVLKDPLKPFELIQSPTLYFWGATSKKKKKTEGWTHIKVEGISCQLMVSFVCFEFERRFERAGQTYQWECGPTAEKQNSFIRIIGQRTVIQSSTESLVFFCQWQCPSEELSDLIPRFDWNGTWTLRWRWSYEALDMISCLIRDQAMRSGQSVRSKILWPILLFRSLCNEMVDTRHLNSCHTRRLFCSHLRPIEPSTLYHLWVETSADWKILQTRTQPWHL